MVVARHWAADRQVSMDGILFFILVLVAIAALFRIDFVFYLVYLLFGAYLLSRWWLERSLSGVRVQHEYESRAFVGDHVRVCLRVCNDSWLPVPWLRIHESLPIHLISPNFYRAVISLLPGQERLLEYELHCRHRGYYALGPLLVSSGDPLGIRTVERDQDCSEALTVYPRVFGLEQLGLQAQSPFGEIASRERLMEDPARIIGVRPYVESDSLRHIHWKTTATTGTLQVKRFEPAISVESMVLINLCRADYTVNRYVAASELAIEAAASIANHLIDRRQTVGLGTTGFDPLNPEQGAAYLPPHKGRAHLMQMLDLLGRIELAEEGQFEPLVRQVRQHLGWGGTAIVITPDLDPALEATLLLVRRQGIHLLVVLVDPHGPPREVRARMEQVGVPCHVLWREEDLDVWR